MSMHIYQYRMKNGFTFSLRLRRMAAILLGYAATQGLTQLFTAISGLIIVRTLAPRDFALFTIAGSAVGVITAVGDSGITSSISSIGGRIWHDSLLVGQLIFDALAIRRWTFLSGIIIAIPLMPGIILAKECSFVTTVGVAVSVGLTALMHVNISTLAAVLRMKLDTRRLAIVNLAGAGFRLLSLTIAAAVAILNLWIALIIGVSGAAFQLWLLRLWRVNKDSFISGTEGRYKKEIQRIVRRQMPSTIFYAYQSQIPIALIGIFGGTGSVAEVGALGRLAVIMAIGLAVVTDVVQPRLTRFHDPVHLRSAHYTIVSLLLSVGGLLVLGVKAFPDPALWLLGKNYLHLSEELPLMLMASILTSVSSVAYGFNMSRGWVLPFWFVVVSVIGVQFACIFIFDLSSVRGVIFMNITLGIASVIISLAYTEVNIWRMSKLV